MAVAKPKPKPSNTKLKAKNISTKTVNLTHGSIEPDKIGTATSAEIATLYKHLIPV